MAVGMPLCEHRTASDVAALARPSRLLRAVSPMHQPANPTTDHRILSSGRPLVADVRDLSLTFATADGKVEAPPWITLQTGEGEFLSFVAPSGCGKRTLRRLIADLEQPTSGMLQINGVSA